MVLRKFSDKEVQELRRDHKDGISILRLSRQHNVTYATMRQLIKRYSYADVPDLPQVDPVVEPKKPEQTLNEFLSNMIGDKSA